MKKRLQTARTVMQSFSLLAALLIMVNAFAKDHPPITITGKITDERTGEAVAGVTVKVKNAATTTTTDNNGIFTIKVDSQKDVLVFTHVGYEGLERTVGTDKAINITFKPSQSFLNEVVVVGYGTQKKQFVTGSVARADLETFRDAPNANFVQMLQGTVPGLNVGQVNVAGQTPSIQIRGASTLSGVTDVLIILDGIQFNGSLQSINPDDIATIDVLKDASATAVYGAQAANGVILVTTKKGKNQKTQVSVSSSYATLTPTQNLKPMGPEEYIEHVRKLYYQQAYLAPDYITPNPAFNVITVMDASNKKNGVLNDPYDWWENSTQTGHIIDNKVSVSGGSATTTYLLSFNNTNQEGFIVNDLFKRNSIRANIETKIVPWWTVGIQSFATFINKDGAEPTLNDILRSSPFVNPYGPDGTLLQNPDNTININPYLARFVDDVERDNFFFGNFYTDIKIPHIKGLSYRVNFGNNYRIFKRYRSSQFAQNRTGEAYKNHSFYTDYTLDNIVTYQRDFGKHNVVATLLYGAIERNSESTNAIGRQFTQLTLGYDAIDQGGIQLVSSDAYKEALNYQMARVNYKFNNKYLLTATVRRDGFSGFSKNNKWGVFPSLSAAWIMSSEKFIEKIKWINYLKLRGGYGVSGNQTRRYASLSTVSSSAAYVFGDVTTPAFGQQQTTLGNSNLRWERTTGASLGLDFEILKSRLTGIVEVYDNITTDLLYNVAIPYSTGYAIISSNIGKLRNKGFELTLNSKNFNKKNFEWRTTVNFSTNQNKIISLLGQDKNGDGIEDDLIASNLFINRSIGTLYGYQTDGKYQHGDVIRAGYYPGTYRIVDQNKDNLIKPEDDRVVLGRTEPAYRYSLLNTFRVYNFTLSVFINSVQGGKDGYMGFNSNPLNLNDNTVRWNYISGTDYWSPSNPNGAQPYSPTFPAITPAIYKNRSFVRLQDITLSYKFDKKITKKLFMQSLSVFASAKNIATWTSWRGWDPETAHGMTIDGRPVLKGYSAGLNVSF